MHFTALPLLRLKEGPNHAKDAKLHSLLLLLRRQRRDELGRERVAHERLLEAFTIDPRPSFAERKGKGKASDDDGDDLLGGVFFEQRFGDLESGRMPRSFRPCQLSYT